jgi:hypothetical protein
MKRAAEEPMSTDQTGNWRQVFENWPTSIPKRGVLVSTLNEVTPFKSFMLKDDILLLERTNPDPLGSRFILLNFAVIHMVKITEPMTEAVFTKAGFAGHLAK